jgi:hypothetical protein
MNPPGHAQPLPVATAIAMQRLPSQPRAYGRAHCGRATAVAARGSTRDP